MSNQYDVLSSPIEGKQQETTRRGGKDDMKEQAHQARTQIKNKAANLKEQVVNSGMMASAQSALQQGIDLVKEKAGIASDVSNEELLDSASEQAGAEWEQVKQRGAKQIKKAADKVDDTLDQNLTKDQKLKLQKGVAQAKKGARTIEREATGWSNRLLDMTMSAPALRPARTFIRKNNLALPALLLMSILSLWAGIALIRLITSVATPAVPEFDIHSKEASMDWAKYHAGELKGKAIDMRSSLTGRAAAFLANHNYDKLRASAVDYRDIGMSKLGLTEPTWSEYAWAKITGRPITWQERVDSILDLTKAGIAARAADMKLNGHGIVNDIKNTLRDGVDSIRSHLPGAADAELLKQRAYDAAHPSTIDQIKSGANYVKNRIVHGSQEAAHIAQDRANELADKAKLKAGL